MAVYKKFFIPYKKIPAKKHFLLAGVNRQQQKNPKKKLKKPKTPACRAGAK